MEYISENIANKGPLYLHVSLEEATYSALIVDELGDVCMYSHMSTTPFSLPAQIPFDSITKRVLRLNTPFTILPSSEYDESIRDKIVREAFALEEADYSASFSFQEYVGLYLINPNLRSRIIKEFDHFSVEHIAEQLLRSRIGQDPSILAHWTSDGLLLVGVHDGLKLINKYAINAPEDAVYYILAAYQKLELNPLDFPLDMSGLLSEESAIFQRLSGFVRDFNWMKINQHSAAATSFEPHLYYHLT